MAAEGVYNMMIQCLNIVYFMFKVSKGGIMIPEKAQQKVNEAVVIAVGPGAKSKVC